MRWFSCLALIALVVTGCATAAKPGFSSGGGGGGGDGGGGGGGGGGIDAGVDAGIDAGVDAGIDAPSMPDAAPLAITLSETTNSAIASSGGITCAGGDGTSSDNTWYRAFQLSDYPMVTGAFHITSVTFGAQQVSAATGVTVMIGSYTGAVGGSTIDTTKITPLANAAASIPDTETGETVNTPITADIPAGGEFVVEIVAPDLSGTGYFYIGSTTASETHPGYITSTGCGVSAPETTVAAGGSGRIVINVNGTY